MIQMKIQEPESVCETGICLYSFLPVLFFPPSLIVLLLNSRYDAKSDDDEERESLVLFSRNSFAARVMQACGKRIQHNVVLRKERKRVSVREIERQRVMKP